MRRAITFLILLVILMAGGTLAMALEITSPAFKNNEFIPQKYSCQGENISPPLEWSGAPAPTKSFALIVDDPDAPMGDWVHWLVYDIPEQMDSLSEDHSKLLFLAKSITNVIKQGLASFGKAGYGGPCPPPGKPHRYFFKLYALDVSLNLPQGVSKAQLLKAMQGHILGQAQLVGLYKR